MDYTVKHITPTTTFDPSLIESTTGTRAALVGHKLFVLSFPINVGDPYCLYSLDLVQQEWDRNDLQIENQFIDLYNTSSVLARDKLYLVGTEIQPVDPAVVQYSLDLVCGYIASHPPYGDRPLPSYGHSIDYWPEGDCLILYGGIAKEGRYTYQYSEQLHQLNLDSMTWRESRVKGRGPGPRAEHSSLISGNEMYIYGGTHGFEEINSSIHVLLLSERGHVWTMPNCRNLIRSARTGSSMVKLRSLVLIFGGANTTIEKTLVSFDTEEENGEKVLSLIPIHNDDYWIFPGSNGLYMISREVKRMSVMYHKVELPKANAESGNITCKRKSR